ncbi:MAG: hypothetical protein A2Z81_03185 [Omnitrophica WOR_2 bacterium GWA2_45_18]|nr:MAG: hypothetical protein A2Z81_03185 [Omnitrophica WOR_2 bacterium GWA2_45_18]
MKEVIFKILLIEDDDTDARIFKKLLSKVNGFRVELSRAGSLAEAAALMDHHVFDVIFLDLSLPDSSGQGTLNQISQLMGEFPVIVLTGMSEVSLGTQAVHAGAEDYLVKDKINQELVGRSVLYAMERNKLRRQLKQLALSDELTGLYNRRGFLTLAEQQIRLCRRKKEGMVFVYLDIDHFKQMNDVHGHGAGDKVLKDVAEVLRKCFRASDIIARIGGDEFVVLAVDADEGSQEKLLRKVQSKMDHFNQSSQRPFGVSLSTGAVYYDPHSKESLEDLLSGADKKMYETKKSKKHNFWDW